MQNLEYKIVETSDIQVLAVQVNQAIAEGWTPQGGVSSARIGSDPYILVTYFQAMIRNKP